MFTRLKLLFLNPFFCSFVLIVYLLVCRTLFISICYTEGFFLSRHMGIYDENAFCFGITQEPESKQETGNKYPTYPPVNTEVLDFPTWASNNLDTEFVRNLVISLAPFSNLDPSYNAVPNYMLLKSLQHFTPNFQSHPLFYLDQKEIEKIIGELHAVFLNTNNPAVLYVLCNLVFENTIYIANILVNTPEELEQLRKTFFFRQFAIIKNPYQV